MKHPHAGRDSDREYFIVMRHVRQALRRGSAAEVTAWLNIAERFTAMQASYERLRTADARREVMVQEHPHRVKLLAARARTPR